MTKKHPRAQRLIPVGLDDIALVGSAEFVKFDHWMDERLAALIDRWASAAAPRAARTQPRGPRGFRTKKSDCRPKKPR